jgi:hypothetical protein
VTQTTGASPWGTPYWPAVSGPVRPPRPLEAMVLAILGGVFIVLGGIAETLVGAAVNSLFFDSFSETLLISGLVGILLGALVITFGVLVYLRPERHTVLGALILVLSVVSLVSFFGGFVIGFVLGLVGGILALVYNPNPVPGPVHFVLAPPVQRICPKCGRVVDLTVRFCPHCGNLPQLRRPLTVRPRSAPGCGFFLGSGVRTCFTTSPGPLMTGLNWTP